MKHRNGKTVVAASKREKSMVQTRVMVILHQHEECAQEKQ